LETERQGGRSGMTGGEIEGIFDVRIRVDDYRMAKEEK
jgi:hypothetical protein